MFGVIVGVVLSITLLTLIPRNQRAAKQFKQSKQKQQAKRKKQQEQKKKQLEVTKNDPALKKKQQQASTALKEKLFKGLSESDRKLLEQYLEGKKGQGKTDAQIIKQATNKAGIFMIGLVLMLVIVVVVFVFMFSGDEFTQVKDGFIKIVASVYPKFAPQAAGSGQDSSVEEL